MPGILILTGSHLCRNPRVVKEASALAEAGYDVTVCGPAFAEELSAEDASIQKLAAFHHRVYCDLRPGQVGLVKRTWLRAQRRVGTDACRRVGWQSPRALGYGVGRLLETASSHPGDLIIGHQEVGAWAAMQLAHRGRRVGVDFEDWYSEDLLPEARRSRPLRLLRNCEGFLQRHAAHATTTSGAMAKALADAYGGSPAKVIYNVFRWQDRSEFNPSRSLSNRPILHWVSQTIGKGRGLENLFAALGQFLVPVEVRLRGSCTSSTREWLAHSFPSTRHELTIHPLVPNSQLLNTIARCDIGLALEQASPPNHDLTVSNKLFHYLLAGLAVVASDTAGQREIAATAGRAVRLFPPDSPEGLAAALQSLLSVPDELTAARNDARTIAEKRYNWESQIPILLESVASALARPVGAPRRASATPA